jgi:hypothetical protein
MDITEGYITQTVEFGNLKTGCGDHFAGDHPGLPAQNRWLMN